LDKSPIYFLSSLSDSTNKTTFRVPREMPLPHSEHYVQASECNQRPLVPIVQATELGLAYWSRLQPEHSDISLQQFAQHFTSSFTQPIGIYPQSNTDEAYPGTPESLFWGASSCPSETTSTSFPPQLLDRRGSLPSGKPSYLKDFVLLVKGSQLPADAIPLEKIQSVDELRRVKRRAQNRAA
jgi:hypothetical protein